MPVNRLDTIGWYIATMHQLLGHRAAANFLGESVEEGEVAQCILCRYEKGEATKDEVIERIGVAP